MIGNIYPGVLRAFYSAVEAIHGIRVLARLALRIARVAFAGNSKRRSILFVNPDYHCSFFLRSELRALGWTTDVLRKPDFPRKLLFSNDVLVEPALPSDTARFERLLQLAERYKYFVVYGDPEFAVVTRNHVSDLLESLSAENQSRFLDWLYRRYGSPELMLLRLMRRKLIYFPNGCRQEALQEDFRKHENGILCANCTFADNICNDNENRRIFRLVNRYYQFVIANTPMPSVRLSITHFKYKSLDLNVYDPDLSIPEGKRLPPSDKIRIMHSFFSAGRVAPGKNVKGSGYVVAAVQRLVEEGYPVEYMSAHDVPLAEMRYLQVQADIVVDQLLYGWWGSTGIEAMALGKPLVCYINGEFKRLFLEHFTEYHELPVVEASREDIYEVLKRLVVDPELRKLKGEQSRIFAQRHYDARSNARELASLCDRL